jgi:hypothetical protein
VPKVNASLSRFETKSDALFAHLRETDGGFRISVLRYWHAFDCFHLESSRSEKKQGTIMMAQIDSLEHSLL